MQIEHRLSASIAYRLSAIRDFTVFACQRLALYEMHIMWVSL